MAYEYFLRREKISAGVSRDTHRLGVERRGRRNDDTTAAVLYCTLHGLTVVARLPGSDEEVTRRIGHGAPCLSISSIYLLAASNYNNSFAYGLEEDKPVHHFACFRPHLFLRSERCSVDVEGLKFRPKAVVVGR